MLPTPDVVLHERILLLENKLDRENGSEVRSNTQQSSVCGVLQLAARKAVGCEDEEALEGVSCNNLARCRRVKKRLF